MITSVMQDPVGRLFGGLVLLLIFIGGYGCAATMAQNRVMENKLRHIKYIIKESKSEGVDKNYLWQMVNDALGEKKGTEE